MPILTIAYFLTAAFGPGVPFTWWALVFVGMTDFIIVHTVAEKVYGPTEEPPTAEDLADSDG